MKKILLLILFLSSVAHAQTVVDVTRGGTGVHTITGVIFGNGTSPFTALALLSDTTKFLASDGLWHTVTSGGGGGSGTVTSVALSLPNIFSVSGSPVTTSGTLSATLASQSQNLVFASPNGSSGSPSFRSLVSNDIPSLTAFYEVPLTFSTGLTRTVNTITVNTSQNISTLSNLTTNGFVKTSGGTGALSIDNSTYLTSAVTSVSATADNGLSVSGSPITSTGTLAYSIKNGGIGDSSLASTFLKTAVTSVGLSLPSEFSVTNSPVTTTGTLTGAWASQTQNKVFASPNGSTGTPSFRALVSGDIPALSYVTSVAASGNNGISISGSPITSSGTLTVGITNGSIGDSSLASTFLKTNQSITLSGDVSGTGTTAITTAIGAQKVTTTMLKDTNVTYPKLQHNSLTNYLLGATTAYHDVQPIKLGTNLTMSNDTLNAASGGGGGLSGLTNTGVLYATSTTTATSVSGFTFDGVSAASLGVSGHTGALKLLGTTSGTMTLTVPSVAGSVTYVLPAADATTNGQVLQSDGSGNMTWTPGVLRLPVTLANCENTGTETAIISVSVPANAFTDGSYIHIIAQDSSLMNDGAAPTLTTKMYWGATAVAAAMSIFTTTQSATTGNTARQWYIYRNGSELDVTASTPTTNTIQANQFAANNAQCMGGGGKITGITFTSTTTLALKIQWASAQTNSWVRMVGAAAELHIK